MKTFMNLQSNIILINDSTTHSDHTFLKIQLLPHTMHEASLRGIIDTSIEVRASRLLEERT